MRQIRTYNYDLHGIVQVRLAIAGCGALRGRLIDSKLTAFTARHAGPSEITIEIGPFRPTIPSDAVVVDKDFWCAPDFVYFRGYHRRGATEISGFTSPDSTTVIRHDPYAEWPVRRLGAGLRGVNLYLEPLIKQRLIHGPSPALLMHGGPVAQNGRALLIFGAKGAFKTRLILDLCVGHGLEFLGDALILLRTGEALSFVESPAVLAERGRAAAAGTPARLSRLRLATQ